MAVFCLSSKDAALKSPQKDRSCLIAFSLRYKDANALPYLLSGGESKDEIGCLYLEKGLIADKWCGFFHENLKLLPR